ncbi:MAG: hypothetical protein IKK64_03555 [Bacteroidales bacterium]|nr:hypothetical protein [Bacteroidales bacterium]
MKDEIIENLDKGLFEFSDRQNECSSYNSSNEKDLFATEDVEEILDDENEEIGEGEIENKEGDIDKEDDSAFSSEDFDKLLDDFIASQLESYAMDAQFNNDKETPEKDDEDYDIEDEDVEDEEDDNPRENIFPLGYQWIIEDISASKERRKFWVFVKDIEEDNLYTFEKIFLYKYFYRFMKPIEYNHPDYAECEESFWPLLLQMLYAETDDVKIIDTKTGVPDIEISYKSDRRTISSLTLEELKSLTSELATKAITDTEVSIICVGVNNDYTLLDNNYPVLKDEILTLFNCYHPEFDKKDLEFVNGLYERIKRYDVDTLPYRFK